MKIKDYEYICDKCDGLGLVKRKYEEFEFVTKSTTCPKCLGDGKLDFIENITGKKAKSFTIESNDRTFIHTDPTEGDTYYDQIKDSMFVYDGNNWIKVCDPVYIGG
jgi:DnaJ-class molecular chaperone